MTTPRPDARSIYEELRAEIGRGELAAGSPLREVAVAERFGVSRTPVREALRRLEHDRLVVPGVRGLQVRAVDAQEVVQVYDVRILLEAEVARVAARARTETDLVLLEGLLARDRGLVDPPDHVRAETNAEFHAAVWQAAHNRVLSDLLHRLTLHLVRTPHSTLSAPGRWEEALAEHGELLRAIADGDGEGAARLAREHMSRAREIRLSLLRTAASGRTGPPPG